jgi:hypothetical protein
MFSEESRHSFLLVIWDRVDVAEAAARRVVHQIGKASRVVDRAFWLEDRISGIDFGGTYVCYVGTGVGPGWVEDIEIRTEATSWSVNSVRCRIVFSAS